jgi:CheY-like chemotaxis protein
VDGQMPGIDGAEMARLVAADGHLRHVPVVGLSGDERAVAAGGDFEAAGALMSVTKPATTQMLLHAIARCLQHAGRPVPPSLQSALQSASVPTHG